MHIARVEADDIARFRVKHGQTLEGASDEIQGLATVTGHPIRVFEEGVADFPKAYEPQEDEGALLPATSMGHELKTLGKSSSPSAEDPPNTVYLYKAAGGYRTIKRDYLEDLLARHKGDRDKFFTSLSKHFAKAIDGEAHSDIGVQKISQLTDGNFASSAFECLAAEEKKTFVEWLHPTRRRIAARLRAEVASQLRFEKENAPSVYVSAQSSTYSAKPATVRAPSDTDRPLVEESRIYLKDVIGAPGVYVGEPACFLAARFCGCWHQ